MKCVKDADVTRPSKPTNHVIDVSQLWQVGGNEKW